MRYNTLLLLLICVISLVVVLFLIDRQTQLKIASTKNTVYLVTYASKILEKCAASSYHPTCYETEVPKLLEVITMEDAFSVTRMIQDKDQTFGYCHVLGHKLSTIEAAKKPDQWMQIIPRCPANGMCANGCLHGALQERFRSESLSDEQVEKVIPDLQIACEARGVWNPTNLDQAICYHGLGHLTVYITDANFEKSLKICDQISKKADGRNFGGVCYEGIFMQLFQPLEPEDFALTRGKEPTKNNLAKFCQQFSGLDQQQACWEEGWPLYRGEVKTAQGISDFCTRSPNRAKVDHCFDMLFTAVGQNANFESVTISKLCSQIPISRRGQCFANGARSMTQADKRFIDKATSFCKLAQPASAADDCFETLADFALYDFHAGSPELVRFCNRLPEKWQRKCTSQSRFGKPVFSFN